MMQLMRRKLWELRHRLLFLLANSVKRNSSEEETKLNFKSKSKTKPQIKKISSRLASFSGEDFQIIKFDKSEIPKIYGKLYTDKKKNKISVRFSQVLSEEKKTKKDLNPHEVIGVPLNATAILRLQRFFVGTVKSVTLVAREVLVHEVLQPQSYFNEYDNQEENGDEEN